MHSLFSMVIDAFAKAIMALLIVNVIYFLIAFSQAESADWHVVFKYGTFSLNGELTGLKLGSSKANKLMLVVAVVTFLWEYRKEKKVGQNI